MTCGFQGCQNVISKEKSRIVPVVLFPKSSQPVFGKHDLFYCFWMQTRTTLVLNAHSEATLLACIQSMQRAILATVGNLSPCVFHQRRMSKSVEVLSQVISDKYFSNSSKSSETSLSPQWPVSISKSLIIGSSRSIHQQTEQWHIPSQSISVAFLFLR